MTWIFLFLIFGLLMKKKSKSNLFFILAGITFLFFSNPLISNYLMRKWEVGAIPKESLPLSDIGVVLTGTLHEKMEVEDQLHFHEGADRAVEAIGLYKNGFIQKILITGGSGSIVASNLKESKLLKDYFILSGVPEEDILIDTKARNTHENAVYTKKMLQQEHLADRKILLITSAFHMRRALGCFQKEGIQVTPFAVDFRSSPVSFDIYWILPSHGSFETWDTLFKEWIGMAAYKAAGYL